MVLVLALQRPGELMALVCSEVYFIILYTQAFVQFLSGRRAEQCLS